MRKLFAALIAFIVGFLPGYSALAESESEGNNVVIIRQGGSASNNVTIRQSGDNNIADIFQEGEVSKADVTQEGGNNTLKATQLGEKNTLKRHQKGRSYTTINQNGKITSYDENGEVKATH